MSVIFIDGNKDDNRSEQCVVEDPSGYTIDEVVELEGELLVYCHMEA